MTEVGMQKVFHRVGALALVALAAIGLAACGSSAHQAGSKNVAVTLTDSGCTPDQIHVASGPVNFEITNGGTSNVSEMELKSESGVILGEAENVVEGIPGSFSLNLDPGKYIVNCPTGSEEDQGTLEATGKATATPQGAPAALLATAAAGDKS